MSGVVQGATVAGAAGAAAVGGVFLGFSAIVMPALDRLAPGRAVAAMQSVNVTAVRPVFMLALFGTAAVCVGLAVEAARGWGDRRATLLAAGAALYLLGVVGVTVARNVPLNDALALVDPHRAAAAAAGWDAFSAPWRAANHLRTVAGVLSGACLALALRA